MKVSISYPPLQSEKGVPLLSQNRQFQWFTNSTFIYPVVPACAASLLKTRGHDVFWDDGIAEGLNFDLWLERLKRERPHIIALESKTPVIKRHWKIIRTLKDECDWSPIILLFGDHVTALPKESMENSAVDFVVTGGDYDFVMAELCDCIREKELLKVQKLPKGIWYRQKGKIRSSGPAALDHALDELPLIDRDLTKWQLYAYRNGNFKYTPGTYTMAGRDCWWGKCSFCSWTTLYPGRNYRTVSVEHQLEEIGYLIGEYKIREIFDDSGCFPKGEWLEQFCEGIIRKGYNKKAVFGCNMRVGALSSDQWKLMRKANFRFILIGLESMNQATLDRLNKGIRVEQIEETIRDCKAAGLMPHITTMVGYPWERKEEAERTIAFARRMFTKGYMDSLQATIVVPYPGTPLFEEAKKNGWILTEDWDDYDMKQSVWKSPVTNEDVLGYTQGLYKAALNPAFIAGKVISIRSMDDLTFLFRAGSKVLAHIADFRKKN
ncbi:MAG: B12-binding domain-containing radical SAM protein [Desulfobacteraceae bacterium 4572_187]|nr:MAG: B12-binding domain-containing radical SAM protein [Desulfobacteraceae bacterium 4572_187]